MRQYDSRKFIQSGYAWRNVDGPFLGESSWSIFGKFCWRNAMNSRDLIDHFNSCNNLDHQRLEGNVDLRFNDRELLLALSSATGIIFDASNQHTLVDLIKISYPPQVRMLCTNYLRFCPLCINLGLHATINQLSFQKYCSYHVNQILLERCPHCNNRIPYAIPKKYLHAYACPSCQRKFWFDQFNCDDKEMRLSIAASFLSSAESMIPLAHTSFGFLNLELISDADLNRFRCDGELFLNFDKFRKQIANHYKTNTWVILDSRKPNPQGVTNPVRVFNFKAIYKSISRHILKHIANVNHEVFRAICNQGWEWPVIKATSFDKIMRHYAYAAWRLHWEEPRSIHNLLSGDHFMHQNLENLLSARFKDKYERQTGWDISESLKLEIFRRIFAFELIESFFQIKSSCNNFTNEMWGRGEALPVLNNLTERNTFFTLSQKTPLRYELRWFVK